ncbi:MAG: Holliday junction branch migration protein RuvA [Clostridiales bacterium]|nr:Holliday junction branch migration protein RuvA [Clostridiales bacterium]
MIAYLTGTITSKYDNAVVLETGGVGFYINVPQNVPQQLISSGKATLQTHLAVKEDNMSLYGFLKREDKRVFELLISVTGVGPKVALSALSALSSHEVMVAIMAGDFDTLSRAPGVGKKTAQRISLELKDKLKNESSLSNIMDAQQKLAMASGNRQDAAEALIALGYSRADAIKTVMECDTGTMKTEQIIRLSLRKLASL